MRHGNTSIWRWEHRVAPFTSNKASGRHAVTLLNSSTHFISRAKPDPRYPPPQPRPPAPGGRCLTHRTRGISTTSWASRETPRGRADPERANTPRVQKLQRLQPDAPLPRAEGRLWVCGGEVGWSLRCCWVAPASRAPRAEAGNRTELNGGSRPGGPKASGMLQPRSQDATSCTPGPGKGELGRSNQKVGREERTKPSRNADAADPHLYFLHRAWAGLARDWEPSEPITTPPASPSPPFAVGGRERLKRERRRCYGDAAWAPPPPPPCLPRPVRGWGRRGFSPRCRPRSLNPVPSCGLREWSRGQQRGKRSGRCGPRARSDLIAGPRWRTAGRLLGSQPGAVSKWPIPSPRAASCVPCVSPEECLQAPSRGETTELVHLGVNAAWRAINCSGANHKCVVPRVLQCNSRCTAACLGIIIKQILRAIR